MAYIRKPLTMMTLDERIEYASNVADSCAFPMSIEEKVVMIEAMVCAIGYFKKAPRKDRGQAPPKLVENGTRNHNRVVENGT